MLLLLYLIYRYDILGEETNRVFWYKCVLVLFISIAGFRYRIGGDTVNYLEFFYHDTPYLWELTYDDLFTSAIEPLSLLLFSVVFSIGGKFFIVQFVQAVFVNVFLFKFFKKHTQYIFTCLFFYYIWMYIYFNFEELRASISMVICLIGNDYLQEKKYVKGYFLYIVGFFFHYSAVLFFLTPFFLLLRFNWVGMMIIILSIPLGIIVQNMFGDYLLLADLDDQISMKASGYINNDEHKQYHGLLYFIVDVGFFVFYSIVSYWYVCIRTKHNKIQKFQPFVVLSILLFCLRANLDIIGRYVHFYSPYLILFYSIMLINLIKNNIDQIKSLAYVRSIVLYIPLLYVILATYKAVPPRMINKSYRNYQKYYPYSSVFERSISTKREKLYDNLFSITPRHSVVKREEY